VGWVQTPVNSPGRDNGDHSFGSFGDPGDEGGSQVVIVPDDISALDAEVRAYRREVARSFVCQCPAGATSYDVMVLRADWRSLEAP